MKPKPMVDEEARRKLRECQKSRRLYKARRKRGWTRTITEKEKLLKAACSRRYAIEHPERRMAWRGLHRAAERGRRWRNGDDSAGCRGGPVIIEPVLCRLCIRLFIPEQLIEHHFAGYDTELARYRSTIDVCRTCHSNLHVEMREAKLLGQNPNDVLRRRLDEADPKVKELIKKQS